MITLHVTTLTAAPGTVWLAGTRHGLVRVGFGKPPRLSLGTTLEREELLALRHSAGPIAPVVRSLEAYLAGEGEPVATLDVTPHSTFAARVIEAVSRIPLGQVRTFDAIARTVGVPRGARAVGRVLAANPVPIFVPCHRVVRKEGSIAGYIGGRAWKRHLLDLESAQLSLGPLRRRRRRAHR
jgi:O-6-methylguanine DNA methyltransferase